MPLPKVIDKCLHGEAAVYHRQVQQALQDDLEEMAYRRTLYGEAMRLASAGHQQTYDDMLAMSIYREKALLVDADVLATQSLEQLRQER